MIQWEYNIIGTTDNAISVKDLNELGKDGWELASRLAGNHLVFKRPVDNNEEENYEVGIPYGGREKRPE